MPKPLAFDLFCGLGGWTDGLLAEGYEVIGYDIEKHQYGDMHYPAELVLQDVLTLDGAQFKDATLIVASPPCFVADTLILTARGLIPIPEVMAGDLVLTHRNRWRRVLETGSTTAATVLAQGHGGSLEGTAEHPIYARRNVGGFSVWDKGEKASVNVLKELGNPNWVPLIDIHGCHWGSPVTFDPLPVPAPPNSLPNTPEFWWIVGRWVGDGWVRLRENTGSGDEAIICCAHTEADDLEARLIAFAPRKGARAQAGELHWRRSKERTAVKFHAASNSLAAWLVANFGRGAAFKTWPSWALGMDEDARRALLDGYVSADGYRGRNGDARIVRVGTVSKRLAVGTKLLASSLGMASNLHFTRRPATSRIEGRTVQQRDTWTASWTTDQANNRHVERDGQHQWGVVRKVSLAQDAARVWNLEVEEDNSYTADGIVVHNCQEYSYMAMPWSLAKAKAADIRADKTGEKLEALNRLFHACFRIQREASMAAGHHIPLVVENVRGAQPWVGRARWNFGSFYLWGDVPALMPSTIKAQKFNPDGSAHPAGSWFAIADSKNRGARSAGATKNAGYLNKRDGHSHTRHLTNPAEHGEGLNQPGISGPRNNGKGSRWFQDGAASAGSKSKSRKMASAMIAKIPLPLSRHIAAVYRKEKARQA